MTKAQALIVLDLDNTDSFRRFVNSELKRSMSILNTIPHLPDVTQEEEVLSFQELAIRLDKLNDTIRHFVSLYGELG